MTNFDDAFHITNKSIKESVYTHTGNWVVWNKPRNCVTVNFFVMGGGGGGGAGGLYTGGQIPSGGPGGGSSSIVSATCPAYMLPDQLFIFVGKGGNGGNAGAGADGGHSFVSRISNNTSASNLYLVSGANPARGGLVGSISADVVGGLGGTVMTTANAAFSSGMTFTTAAGQQGATAQRQFAGASMAALSAGFTMGGPSGGGINTTPTAQIGGNVTGVTGIVPTILGGQSSGLPGLAGCIITSNGLIATSGSAGAASLTIGGNGGKSEMGCGGPGGGAGATQGRGGDGGDGLVIITAI